MNKKVSVKKRIIYILIFMIVAVGSFTLMYLQGEKPKRTGEDDGSVKSLPIDDSMSFDFALISDNSHSITVKPGDEFTVRYIIKRVDEDSDFRMYAVQNEIQFDGKAFELVNGSLRSSYTFSVHELGDGVCSIFMNGYSPDPEGVLLSRNYEFGSFVLKARNAEGEYKISSNNCEMSTKGGTKLYMHSVTDLDIKIEN